MHYQRSSWYAHEVHSAYHVRGFNLATLLLSSLKSDTLRYLLLLVRGGVYTDVDTSCLKPIVDWGANAALWKGGKDWLVPSRKGQTMESMIQSLGPPSVVVGVEANVGDRADWNDVRRFLFAAVLYPQGDIH